MAHGAQLETSLASHSQTVRSPLGFSANYSYHLGVSLSIFAQYCVVTAGKSIFLNGFSIGANYALFGGKSYRAQAGGDSTFQFEFPYRLGFFLAGAQRRYDFSSLASDNFITFEKKVPPKGDLLGLEFGLTLDVPINSTHSFGASTSYLLPSFSAEAAQKGRILSLGLGFGMQL